MSTNQTWRKSSRSSAGNSCVELSAGPPHAGIRDSKNPTGPTLTVTLGAFLPAIKSGHFDR